MYSTVSVSTISVKNMCVHRDSDSSVSLKHLRETAFDLILQCFRERRQIQKANMGLL